MLIHPLLGTVVLRQLGVHYRPACEPDGSNRALNVFREVLRGAKKRPPLFVRDTSNFADRVVGERLCKHSGLQSSF